MIKKWKYLICIPLGLAAASCSKFDELNTDPVHPSRVTTDQSLLAGEKLSMDELYFTYVNNRVGMHYAQYWSATDKESNSQYQLDATSTTTLWSEYNQGLQNLEEVKRTNAELDETPTLKNQNAIADILEVWIYHFLTDAFGDIPYSETIKNDDNPTPKYDHADSIYTALLKRLDTDAAALDPAQPSFTTGDNIYQGDVSKWKKLANSLKLRIAMRMADANPSAAKTAVEAAVKAGVMQGPEDDALYLYTEDATNRFPYNNADKEPIEFVLSKTMVDYLDSLNDPRLPVYARKARATGTYIGKIYGLGTNSASEINDYSQPGTTVYSAAFPGILMTSSEVEFLLAEAVERGMQVGGSAEEHFRKAIRNNFSFWEKISLEPMDEQAATQYADTLSYSSDNWKNIIGTQKWIAMYMQGLQSWFERLRLDFKKPDGTPLFVAPRAGSLDPNVKDVPTRLTYPASETSTNGANLQTAVEHMGGDTQGIRNWWDKH
ncbi:SusD/RagB family nutrient-binding outer membrane lipoprotein [Compostibacter hankyongensis]